MADTGQDYLVAQSGLISSNREAPNHTSTYVSDIDEYHLEQGADVLYVPLTWKSGDGIDVTKTFIFHRGRYDVEVRHDLSNRAGGNWTGNRYDQLQRTRPDDSSKASFTNPGRYSYVGGALYSPEEKFEKVDFDDIADGDISRSTSDGWLAMIQHYFFTAWIPPKNEINAYSTKAVGGNGGTRYLPAFPALFMSGPNCRIIWMAWLRD
jgi:YidC/Oxa1 family membrane protein insertase